MQHVHCANKKIINTPAPHAFDSARYRATGSRPGMNIPIQCNLRHAWNTTLQDNSATTQHVSCPAVYSDSDIRISAHQRFVRDETSVAAMQCQSS
eukprot:752398-Amphidinium_carterae.1